MKKAFIFSEPEDQDEPWLDSKTDIVELLLAGDEVAKSESSVSESHDTELAPVTSTPFVPIVSEDEAIEQLIESLERPVPDGIIDLDNGQVGSQSLLELLTNDIGEHNEAVHLTADDIESILSSNPSSPVGSTDDSFDSDPDWSPSDSYSSQSTSRSKQTFVIQSPVPSRPAPYEKQGRSVYSKADKKLRKKEQNRTAATRYRQKKKKEQDCTMDEYLELETKNKDLKDKVDSISQEIAYLKKLMADVYKARKQLKK